MDVRPCPCYKCAGPIYDYDSNGNRIIVNNVHGRLQPCDTCGQPKTEYVDLGRKGYYECWWCTRRAGPDDARAFP